MSDDEEEVPLPEDRSMDDLEDETLFFGECLRFEDFALVEGGANGSNSNSSLSSSLTHSSLSPSTVVAKLAVFELLSDPISLPIADADVSALRA